MIQALLLLLAAQDPRVVEGFSIGKAADSSFPMFACFDDKGRLYVTESSGGDLYVELQKLTRGCKVRRFEDKDGDGSYETSTVFAENLTPSMGLAWRDGKLYVADPPDLAVLEDSDGDGRADRRTVILTDFGHKDNGSLHGLTFGPDGLLYGTMGQPDGYRLKAADGTLLTGVSGMLFRCRPDGSHPEVLCRGFENLVEVVFLPGGDILGTTNWYQKPVGGIRDAIVHLVPGGLYPYVPDTGTKYPFSGDVIPPLALFPAVALSGLVRYEGTGFPEAMRGNLFSAQHNSRKVMRHVLARAGASYASQDAEFVWSENPDFHPSDVLEAPDGSLLVIDTGAWYVQHCPTGKIRNSRAPGGIYRVKSTAKETPAGEQLKHGLAALERQEVWSHSRVPGEDAFKHLSVAMKGPHAGVAVRAVGRLGEKAFAPALAKLLSSKDPSIQLAAAEALATCGTPGSLPEIWEALAATTDRFVEHQLVHAAFALARLDELEDALKHESPRVRKAAIVLLDQKDPRLQSETVLGLAGAADPGLRQAALRILQKRPAWAKDAHLLLQGWLDKEPLSGEERATLQSLIVAFQAETRIQNIVGLGLRQLAADRKVLLLETLAQTSLPKTPEPWLKGVGASLGDDSLVVRAQAIRTITVLATPDFDDRLAAIAGADGPLRLSALRALVARRPKLPGESVDFLVSTLAADAPLDRLAASETLGRAHLSSAQVSKAVRAVRGDTLLSPSLFLPALREPADAALLGEMTEAVKAGWRPSPQELAPVLEKASADLTPLREAIAKGTEEQRARLEKVQPLLAGGDATRGRAVFFGKKVACSACHAIGTEGGRIGPDLTKVGAIRSGRDLLESIVVPSSTFAQGYEAFIVATKDGDVLGGLIARQDADALVLKDAAGAETRVRRDRIRDLKRGEKSIMPEGLERNLSEQEFRDLLAFLQGLK